MSKFTSIGADWDDVRRELFTPKEIAESDQRVAELSKQIEAKEKKEEGSYRSAPSTNTVAG